MNGIMNVFGLVVCEALKLAIHSSEMNEVVFCKNVLFNPERSPANFLDV